MPSLISADQPSKAEYGSLFRILTDVIDPQLYGVRD